MNVDEVRTNCKKVFLDADVRIVKSISVQDEFGDPILRIYAHANDLYTCNFDNLMDSIEKHGYKTGFDNKRMCVVVKLQPRPPRGPLVALKH